MQQNADSQINYQWPEKVKAFKYLTLCKSTLKLDTFIKVDVYVLLLLFWIFNCYWKNAFNFEVILECDFIPYPLHWELVSFTCHTSQLQMIKCKPNTAWEVE